MRDERRRVEAELADQPALQTLLARFLEFQGALLIQKCCGDARMRLGVSGEADGRESDFGEKSRFKNVAARSERPADVVGIAAEHERAIDAFAAELAQKRVERIEAFHASCDDMRNRREAGVAQSDDAF